jgi:GNAT superfamily N-acetyltransferase
MVLRKAIQSELTIIWEILQFAIEQRRLDGSKQWQDGYPNPGSIQNDLDKGYAYVLEENGLVLVYAAIMFEKEPAYEEIDGKWLTDGEYVVLHRVAASPLAKGKGVATKLFQMVEALCLEKKIYSIKVDTNFDNQPMLKIMDKLGYTYCGEVIVNNGIRKAFEKVLANNSKYNGRNF